LEENKKLLIEAKKVSQGKVSLIIVKEPSKINLNSVVAEENKGSNIKIKMDHINVPVQINFHKQT
jgi:hypothetical protein